MLGLTTQRQISSTRNCASIRDASPDRSLSPVDAVKTLSKHEKAYTGIRESIMNGGYQPGERLAIPRLTRDLGMSALPIREALRRLEAEGLIRFDRNVGARVTWVDGAEWESAMHVLSLLEGYATSIAAGHLHPADLEELREINARFGAALEAGDIGAARDLNRQFHVRMYEACPNDYLMGLVRVGWNRLDSLRGWDTYYLLIRGSHLVGEHAELLEMIEHGAKSSDIEAFARGHKLRTVATYQKNKDVLPLPHGWREG